MNIDPDIVLPLLVVAILANTVVMAAVVIAGRTRARRMAPSAPRSAVDQALAASYLERSARMSPGPIPASVPMAVAAVQPAGPDDDDADDDDSGGGTDQETGLLDGPAFHRLVLEEDRRLRRYHRPATIAVIDLDGLDKLTESLGAKAGERVVAAMADSIRRLAREADHVARLETGRFAVLLPETDEIAAIHYVERVRRASELWLESGAIALRLAIGWAGSTGDPSLPETQQLALDRMFAELRRGARRADPAQASGPSVVGGSMAVNGASAASGPMSVSVVGGPSSVQLPSSPASDSSNGGSEARIAS